MVKVPVYQKIKAAMIEEIKQLEVNAAILSERSLAEKYNVSRMTVRKAVNELVDEGYLYRDLNKGTFVADEKLRKKNTSVKPFEKDDKQTYKMLYFDVKATSEADVQEKLNIRSDDSILRVVRLMLYEDRPQMIEEIYIARKNIAEEELSNIKKLLDLNVYIEQGSLTQTFVPILVPVRYAHLLKLKLNTPILLVKNVITSKNGKPLIYVKVFNHPQEKVIEITL